jgi:hypothetical protein
LNSDLIEQIIQGFISFLRTPPNVEDREIAAFSMASIKILGVTEGMIRRPASLRKDSFISRTRKLYYLGPELIEHMSPAPLAVTTENPGLFFIHFKILSKNGLS